MAFDECMLKGERGRCASWPILDVATQVHPGLHLGGGGNGVCISHAKSLVRDAKRGDLDLSDPDGHEIDIEGNRIDGQPRDEEFRRRIERVHEIWRKVSGAPAYLRKTTKEAAMSGVKFVLPHQSDPEQAVQHLRAYDEGAAEPKQAAYDVAIPGDRQVREGATFNRTPNRATKPVNTWDKDVMHAVTKDGGFTFHDATGDGPSEGYMVSVAKNNEVKVPLRDLTSAHVADYMSLHQQELKDPNNFLGGWVHKGNVYLDISRHTQDRNEAMKLARANQQLGIYDIGKGETLMTEKEQAKQRAAAKGQPDKVDFVVSHVQPGQEEAVSDFVNALRATAGLEPLASDGPPTAIQRAALRVVRDEE